MRVALVYTLVEGGLVSIVIPDDPDQGAQIGTPPGCAALWVDRHPEDDVNHYQAAINAVTGKSPRHCRMAIVNDADGLVEGVVLAYRSIFTPPAGRRLTRSLGAEPGDWIIGGELVKKPQPEEPPEEELLEEGAPNGG